VVVVAVQAQLVKQEILGQETLMLAMVVLAWLL
jgi:hypothetical protein